MAGREEPVVHGENEGKMTTKMFPVAFNESLIDAMERCQNFLNLTNRAAPRPQRDEVTVRKADITRILLSLYEAASRDECFHVDGRIYDGMTVAERVRQANISLDEYDGE